MLPDSGSSVSMLPLHMAQKMGALLHKLETPLRLAVCGPAGVLCHRRFEATIKFKDKTVRTTVFVAKDVPPVLSSAASYGLELLIRPSDNGTGQAFTVVDGGCAAAST